MWRHFLIFLVIGSVLVAARRVVSARAPERPELVVRVPRDVSEAERQRRVDEAVLVDAAVRSGWARSDPLVIERLRRNMRFAEGAASGDAVDRAIELGMHRSDPVVKRRLVKRTRDVLGARALRTDMSDQQLSAYARAHRQRFEWPATQSFSHVLISKQRHGDSMQADAQALSGRLASASRRQGERWSDPWLHPYRFEAMSAQRIDATFGSGFATQLEQLQPGSWAGPLRSSYGLHFVWLEARTEARLPPLSAMRRQVVHAVQQEQREQGVRDGLAALRRSYQLVVEVTP